MFHAMIIKCDDLESEFVRQSLKNQISVKIRGMTVVADRLPSYVNIISNYKSKNVHTAMFLDEVFNLNVITSEDFLFYEIKVKQ